MKRLSRWLANLLSLFVACAATGQSSFALPEIVNYTKQVYRGGAETRKIAQDKAGILYFANDEGLLTYNSVGWKLYPLPNKSRVRCVQFGADGKIYVGGQDEFGYFAPSANGILVYCSLKNLLPVNYRSFSDVWGIGFFGSTLFFQTSDRIYEVAGNRVTVHTDGHWRFMSNLGKDLIVQSRSRGILRFQNGAWQPLSEAAQRLLPTDYYLTSVTPIGKDSLLLTTLKNGFYILHQNNISRWESPTIKELEGKNVSYALMVNENHVAIGTSVEGCYVLDKGGSLVQRFGREEGLQDNNILTVFLDQQKNIWFGLHNGIVFIPYNNAVKHINPPAINEGAGYTSYLYQKALYIGTSTGLFRFPLSEEYNFSTVKSAAVPIKNSTGEVWNLSEVDGQLLMGHNEGSFLIRDATAEPLDKSEGYWNFQSFAPAGYPPLVAAGTYKGISFFSNNKTGLQKNGEATVESARFVIPMYNRLWLSHPYKGIYTVELSNGKWISRKYAAKEGVLSDNNNYLFKVKGKLLLTTENGVYEFDSAANRFQLSAFYNTHLPKSPIRYLKEDAEGNVWFVYDKKVGVLDLSSATPQCMYIPELTNKFVAGFEHINPIDKQNILIGGEKGFYHVNYQQYKKLNHPLHVLIGAVLAINQNDSLLYGGYPFEANKSTARFSHELNSLRFEFATPVYGQSSNIKYSFYLQGLDKSWSEYGGKTEKEYTNLPPGNYVFNVKARNNLGNESTVSSYAFSIAPPWYQTPVAYSVYLFAICVGVYVVYRMLKEKFRMQQARHEEEQRRLLYMHQLELEKAEKELVELRNAKLEAEITAKNTELASTSLHLVQKNDVLQKIRAKMIKMKDQPQAVESTADLKSILKTLTEENKVEEEWQQFSLHFDAIHRNFLFNLKKRHPDLTPNEQKLCAYLKLNLSTKEIAQLMNISVRGVEISRYRLRKKLGVQTGTHLFNFLDAVE